MRPLCAPWSPLRLVRHWQELHGYVEALVEGDVEETIVDILVEREVGRRVGWLTICLAGEHALAVACLTRPVASAVKRAARSCPYTPSSGVIGHLEDPCLPWVEPHATTHRQSGRPYGVGASVGDVEYGLGGDEWQEQEPEKEEEGRWVVETQGGGTHNCQLCSSGNMTPLG